ncbi:MAG: sulfate reduction electron transfer complex DsrMKJOP subunit DsrJ [Caldimicrobium sp.]|jgi:hypothetical protein
MYNTGKVLIGILIFIIFFTFPFWLNLGKVRALPKPELPKEEKKCVEDTEYMRAYHMKLLDEWRIKRIRKMEVYHMNHEGKLFIMSLQRTCMKCHTNKEKFCDKCHEVLVTHPDCWKCHIAPEEAKKW